MGQSLYIPQFRANFQRQPLLSNETISSFYQQLDPAVKTATINWRIHELVHQGILERVSKGKYHLGKAKPYHPVLSRSATTLYGYLRKNFPYAEGCIWELSWLNEFTQHQFKSRCIIIEMEKDVCESVFYRLQEKGKRAFLKPSAEMMERYVIQEKQPVIILPLISESPLITIGGIKVPSLEKILVDIYTEKNFFYPFQGLELKYIWENAREKYTLLEDKLLRYANRRKKRSAITQWLASL